MQTGNVTHSTALASGLDSEPRRSGRARWFETDMERDYIYQDAPKEEQRKPRTPREVFYRNIFSHPRMIRDLLEGFVPAACPPEARMETLERVAASHASDRGTEFENDRIWRDQLDEEGKRHLCFMLEIQKTPDAWMPLRMASYVSALYTEMQRGGKLSAGSVPVVVPIVLYRGDRKWNAALAMEELITENWPQLAEHRLRMSYILVNTQKTQDLDLSERNLVDMLFRMDRDPRLKKVTAVTAHLRQWLAEDAAEGNEQEAVSLQRAFGRWIMMLIKDRARETDVPDPETVKSLAEVSAVLEGPITSWADEARAEGLDKGRAEGRVEGRAKERIESLVVVAQSRFGGGIAEALQATLRPTTPLEKLREIFDWSLTCDSGEALLAKARANGAGRSKMG